jgi:hypothetical protein
MTDKILARVVGDSHQRANGKGGFDSFPPGSVIEATPREMAAFAGRLVPANQVVAEVTKPARVPYRGIPADQVPPAGTSEVPPGGEGGDGGSQ